MSRSWTRSQQRRYREQRRAFAARCADRLLYADRKKVDPDIEDFFGGSQMQAPIQYKFSGNIQVPNPRSSIFLGGISV